MPTVIFNVMTLTLYISWAIVDLIIIISLQNIFTHQLVHFGISMNLVVDMYSILKKMSCLILNLLPIYRITSHNNLAEMMSPSSILPTGKSVHCQYISHRDLGHCCTYTTQIIFEIKSLLPHYHKLSRTMLLISTSSHRHHSILS